MPNIAHVIANLDENADDKAAGSQRVQQQNQKNQEPKKTQDL